MLITLFVIFFGKNILGRRLKLILIIIYIEFMAAAKLQKLPISKGAICHNLVGYKWPSQMSIVNGDMIACCKKMVDLFIHKYSSIM